MTPSEGLLLRGPAGTLEALWHPRAGAEAAALLCHSHPQYGGTLRDRVVHRLARALHGAGFAVLRFNYRGVGGSEGAFDGGRGERDDVGAALDHVAREHPRVVVVGYSFGAWVGLAASARDPRVAGLCGVGAPVDVFDFRGVAGVERPLLFVHGGRDAWGSVANLRAAVDAAGPRASLALLADADHGFRGHLEAMTDAVVDFARRV